MTIAALLDELLCGERLDNRQHNEADFAELPPICDSSQPAWLHISKMAHFEMYQWVLKILSYAFNLQCSRFTHVCIDVCKYCFSNNNLSEQYW